LLGAKITYVSPSINRFELKLTFPSVMAPVTMGVMKPEKFAIVFERPINDPE
jgi:hypothetical protein